MAKFAVETRLTKLAVDTMFAMFAVETKLTKLAVETCPAKLAVERYPKDPRIGTVNPS